MARQIFQRAAEVKRYLRAHGVVEPVSVRKDRSSADLWFNVTPILTYDCLFGHVSSLEEGGSFLEKSGPSVYARIAIIFPALAEIDAPLDSGEFMRQFADAEKSYISSDAGATAEIFNRLTHTLRNTNAIVGP